MFKSEKEPKLKKERLPFKEFAKRAMLMVGLGSTAVWFLGNHFVDKINNEGIKPAVEKEGDELESALNDTVSKEDVETVIKVGCGLHNQMAIPGQETTDLTELCLEYLPQEESPQEELIAQPGEVAQDTTYYVTTTTTQP